MTTAHHPVPTRVGSRHDHDWLWIGLTAILIALMAGAISWAVFRPDTAPTTAPGTAGFAYDHEVTPARTISPGVTVAYFGHSGALDAVVAPVRGFEVDHEATSVHLASPGITTTYFGHSGELYPMSARVGGFDADDDTTTMHLATDGVTTIYFGNSGEIDADN